jgi:hypothetical protein
VGFLTVFAAGFLVVFTVFLTVFAAGFLVVFTVFTGFETCLEVLFLFEIFFIINTPLMYYKIIYY